MERGKPFSIYFKGTMASGTVISYPIPAYANVPINAQFYQPRRFIISALTRGATTTITTSEDHDYVTGQLVRLLIPVPYGSFQLNQLTGYVTSVPTTTQVIVEIDSTKANLFKASPFVANISGATRANPCVLTVDQPVYGNSVLIQNVGGMTQLNGNVYQILAQRATSITIQVDSSSFSLYTSGGTATVFPTNGSVAQIVAVGDINSGVTNTSGRNSTGTFIPGSFVDISPA